MHPDAVAAYDRRKLREALWSIRARGSEPPLISCNRRWLGRAARMGLVVGVRPKGMRRNGKGYFWFITDEGRAFLERT